jgi:hypothetical protein
MADAELIRHQQTWKGFTNLIKITIAVIVATLGILALWLLP